jgi:cysteinyl-tRNA synthetase
MIRLHDTMTREKRDFVPLNPQRITMYVCGPTVYGRAHIGNARPAVVFDTLARLIRHEYGDKSLVYARNVTDVDDKIIASAEAEGVDPSVITERYERFYLEDMGALGVRPPDIAPHATREIAGMVAMIERLVGLGHAYEVEGHVLFAVPSWEDYGELSRRDRDAMVAGARVEVAPYKRDPMDFVLWKPSKVSEPAWASPAGISTPGRPGWHIECSAMSWKHLGETFDIHGGGIDLVFPHHENEIAQSRCTFHTPIMAQIWMHNGFLQVEGEKMAKSAGNFVTLREVLADWPGDVARLAMMSSHYRQPINWTVKGLDEAMKTLESFFDAASGSADPRPALGVLDALTDDLNTPKAIAEMHSLKNATGRKALAGTLAFLGFRAGELTAWQARHRAEPALPTAEIESRIAARNAARQTKNFTESDRIRDELAAMGVVLKDSKEGTTWELAR